MKADGIFEGSRGMHLDPRQVPTTLMQPAMDAGWPAEPAAAARCRNCGHEITLDDEGASEFGIAIPVAWPCGVARAAGVIAEYGTQCKSGDRVVWDTAPYIEKVYPLAKRIEDGRLDGGRVYRRRIIVVDDWAEVAGP